MTREGKGSNNLDRPPSPASAPQGAPFSKKMGRATPRDQIARCYFFPISLIWNLLDHLATMMFHETSSGTTAEQDSACLNVPNGRGRDGGCPPPPAQIPAGGITAPGS